MNELADRLTISEAQAVRRLDDNHDFDRVITLGYYDGMDYSRPEASTHELTFPDGPHDYTDFEAAVNLVQESLEDGHEVLVHCQAGVSRSPAVCAAVLAARNNLSYETAIAHVKKARPRANPTDPLEASARRYIEEEVDVR